MSTISPELVAELNPPAQALYDIAFAHGRDRGASTERSRLAQQHARDLLGLAEVLLRGATHTDDREIALAIMALARTPMIVPEVGLALSALRQRIRIDRPLPDVDRARELVTTGLERLGR